MRRGQVATIILTLSFSESYKTCGKVSGVRGVSRANSRAFSNALGTFRQF